MTIKISAVTLAGGMFLLNPVSAEMQWSDSRFVLRHGEGYELDYSLSSDDSIRDVFSFEHASGHGWGDLFMFIDRFNSSDDSNEVYGEISPRLSLGKISGSEWSFGPVKDVLFASTMEFASFDDPDGLTASRGGFNNILAGVGIDLELPGFSYAQLNVYHRSNDYHKNNEQLTFVWGVPFKIGSAEFVYDGYIDWRTPTAEQHTELNFSSQLKFDLGALLWGSTKKLYVGVKYIYWDDKYGIKDGSFGLETNERNANLLLQWHL